MPLLDQRETANLLALFFLNDYPDGPLQEIRSGVGNEINELIS